MSLPLPVQTALISAGTAAVVTVLVEYAAKPRLEVRKDRIVARAKTMRDLETQVLAMLAEPPFRLLMQRNRFKEVAPIRLKAQVSKLSDRCVEAQNTAEHALSLGLRGVRGRLVHSCLSSARQEIDNLENALDSDQERSSYLRPLLEAHLHISLTLNYFVPRWRWRLQMLTRTQQRRIREQEDRRRAIDNELFSGKSLYLPDDWT